nr:PIG-L family deacetylase [Pseudobdellovibrionaceae bacterium]
MAFKKTQKLNNLLVIAHPDDEALFFSGLVLYHKKDHWTIVCVTDANADENGTKRKKDFKKSCKLLGVEKHYF